MTMIRISGRNSVIPPAGDCVCASKAGLPATSMSRFKFISPFPPGWAILPRLAGYVLQIPKMLPRSGSRPAPSCVCLPEACLKVRAETFKVPKLDSLTNLPHDVKVKVEIVVGVQDDG